MALGYDDVDGVAVGGAPPAAFDPAVAGVECTVGPVEAETWGGGEADGVVAGGGGLDAGDDLVEPVGDGAEGVVVEGGHVAGVDGAVGQHGVPAFPDGGGAHGHGVQPGRAGVLQQQPVGVVDVSGLRQRPGDERGAGEPGADRVVAVGDDLGEPVPGRGSADHGRAGRSRWRGRRRWRSRTGWCRRRGRSG